MRRSLILPLATAILVALTCGDFAYAESIPLKPEGGTFVIPVTINGMIVLDFTIDSGAADVSIPADVYSTLVRSGTVAKDDLLDTQRYRLADGSEQSSRRFRIRSLRVGNVELPDVIASVAPAEGDLLLGQSFLSRLPSWSIDNGRHVLLLNETAKTEARPATREAASTHARVSKPPGSVQSDDEVFLNALAYLLTGDDLGKITVLDRSKCVVQLRQPTLPPAPDFITILHLNNVDRTRSAIRAVPYEHPPKVQITLRGEGVAEYPARPIFKTDTADGKTFVSPGAPGSSSSTHTIILYGTNETARLRRAWNYIYSHGCKGLQSSF